MKINKKYNNLKYFFVSMIISEIFLMLFLGLIIAEHNIRYIILGSEESLFTNSVLAVQNTAEFIRVFFTDFVKNISLKSYFYFI